MKLLKQFSFILLIFSSINFAQGQQPKNIIILIGDGMGVPALSTSILSDSNSPFMEFTSIGFSITTALDNLITDSAAGATAISTGIKTNNGPIAISPKGEPLKTIFEQAEEINMATGLVVTSSVTHATPAAFYAHTDSRKNELEIAQQLLEKDIEVVIGAGMKFFKKSGWVKNKAALLSSGYNVYENSDSLLQDNSKQKIFAIIDDEAVMPAAKRNFGLSQLVAKALDVLNYQNHNGFILLVEGSQIDWAGHENDSYYLLTEMKDFAGAVNEALQFAEKDKNTLVIVTADHETGGAAITGGDLKTSKQELSFSTFYHTAGMVPVLAKGPSEEMFRGIYQNNEIGEKLFKIVSLKNTPAEVTKP